MSGCSGDPYPPSSAPRHAVWFLGPIFLEVGFKVFVFGMSLVAVELLPLIILNRAQLVNKHLHETWDISESKGPVV